MNRKYTNINSVRLSFPSLKGYHSHSEPSGSVIQNPSWCIYKAILLTEPHAKIKFRQPTKIHPELSKSQHGRARYKTHSQTECPKSDTTKRLQNASTQKGFVCVRCNKRKGTVPGPKVLPGDRVLFGHPRNPEQRQTGFDTMSKRQEK